MFRFFPTFPAHVVTGLVALGATAGLVLLAGCPSQSSETASAPAPVAASASLAGAVYGGRQPIANASVKVYASGMSGGSPAQVIGTATTGSGGKFNISTFSSQPQPGQVVYIVASGGDSTGSGPNANIRLMTVAADCVDSSCSNLPSQVNINELSTVAAAYSMEGFVTFGPSGLDISGTLDGLLVASANFSNLVDAATGRPHVLGLNSASACDGSSGEPVNCDALRRMNTLANILAACVNQENAANTCQNLYNETSTVGADTLDAMLHIVQDNNARANGDGIFALAGPAANIYNPALSAAPHAWVLALNIDGNGTYDQPSGIAISSTGRVAVANTGNNTVAVFASTSATPEVRENNGLDAPIGLAYDSNGQHDNLWVANSGNAGISEFESDGQALGHFSNDDGINGPQAGPYGIAVSPYDQSIWVTNAGASSLTEFDGGGGILKTVSANANNGLDAPHGIAIANNQTPRPGAFGVANSAGASINGFYNDGTVWGPLAGGSVQHPEAMAGGPHGYGWATLKGADLVLGINAANPQTGLKHLQGNGLDQPIGVAVSAANHVWIANNGGNSISGFDGADKSSLGHYTAGGLNGPWGIAVDRSGNIWVTNHDGDSLTEFIGIDSPTCAPLVDALAQDDFNAATCQ